MANFIQRASDSIWSRYRLRKNIPGGVRFSAAFPGTEEGYLRCAGKCKYPDPRDETGDPQLSGYLQVCGQ